MTNKQNRFLLPPESWVNLLFWLACLIFTGAVVNLGLHLPTSFAPLTGQPKSTAMFGVSIVVVLLLGGLGVILYIVHRRPGEDRPAIRSLIGNFAGLALAALFFIIYFSLALSLGALPDDNFYDTDSTSWLNRFSAPAGELIDMRPVHPFAFLIFRPLVWLASLLTGGDKILAALLLNAATGALCVFLAWRFVKDQAGNGTFALLTAALLGTSASHLVLSASLETYIYSAAVLIAFLVLVRREDRSLKTLVPVGLLTFGITITNFVQTLILLFFADPKIVKAVKYTLIVLLGSIALAFVQVRLYPSSQPFYDAAQLLSEDRYSFNMMAAGVERTVDRANAYGRTMTLFGIVAPRPLVLLKETGCEFPCFQTYKHRWNGALMHSYAGLGSLLARTWFALLAGAAGFFLWRWIKTPQGAVLQASLLACLAFNFILHMNYGDDPLLYSGDWTYAVVFFVVLSYKDLAGNRWLQAGFLAFLALLMVNNWRFLQAVLNALSPFMK
jgi:hypothetical protein